MRVAVIGTGLMGAGMARSMRRAGLVVTAWNRTAEKAEPLAEDGVEVKRTVGDAVEGADAVVTMLFDADAVLELTPELLEALGPNSTWLQSSTVGPDGIGRIAEKAGETHLLDAPVLGTREPAEQGLQDLVPNEVLRRVGTSRAHRVHRRNGSLQVLIDTHDGVRAPRPHCGNIGPIIRNLTREGAW